MKYQNELQVKKALGIDSFRNLSKSNVMKFAAMMPDMDREVRFRIIEQFPEFTRFALDALETLSQANKDVIQANQASKSQVHEAWSQVREILSGQLKDEDLSWEQRKYIIDLIVDTARDQSLKDSENKQFLKEITRLVAAGSFAALVGSIIYIGGRVGFESHSEADNQDEA